MQRRYTTRTSKGDREVFILQIVSLQSRNNDSVGTTLLRRTLAEGKRTWTGRDAFFQSRKARTQAWDLRVRWRFFGGEAGESAAFFFPARGDGVFGTGGDGGGGIGGACIGGYMR